MELCRFRRGFDSKLLQGEYGLPDHRQRLVQELWQQLLVTTSVEHLDGMHGGDVCKRFGYERPMEVVL
jgi:hypothetical protein